MPAVVNVLHMNAGNGESSYAKNSTVQNGTILLVVMKSPFKSHLSIYWWNNRNLLTETENAILMSQKVVLDTVKDYATTGFAECFKLADLGCSSGPNTLLVVSNIIDNVHAICHKENLKTPEIQVFLNDLPENDFNTIFKMVTPFVSKFGDESGKCFLVGAPGSFYTRLFLRRNLHFVHSSYSVHWLSQVPEKLENNKKNIYMTKTSPPDVYQAYFYQFKKDFSTFLRMRSEEIVPNGRMVLTFLGRSIDDPSSNDCCCLWELLADSLHDVLVEGLIQEDDLNSFNLPIYTPSKNEVNAIIELEGSFNLDKLESIEVNWDLCGDDEVRKSVIDTGKLVAKTTRAVTEPMLASHFGSSNFVDKVFERYAMHVSEHLSRENTKNVNIVISLSRKVIS